MKKILISLFIITVAATLTAQPRPFEETKNSYDPYVAQKGGFESLFVNPAAMSRETDIFTWDIEAGTKGKRKTYETIQFMMENQDMLTGGSTGATLTPADAEQIMDLLADNMTDQAVQDMLVGTTIAGTVTTPEELIAYLAAGDFDPDDANIIATNIENDPTIVEDALESLVGELKISVEFTTKVGTLIRGFGLGVYGNVYSVLDAGEMGFDTLIAETGVKAGYGFPLGPINLGVSGDFAFIGDFAGDTALTVDALGDIMNQTMFYGYAWGFDVGATYDILPSLTVGAVMTDIIGTYVYAGTSTLSNFSSSKVELDSSYEFDLDLDFGVTWAPKLGSGKLFNASFSADYYDFIGLFRDSPSDFQGFMDHMRFGAHIELLSFINARAMYYQEFFTLGAGVDLLFLEVFGEFMFNQTFDDIGGALLVKLHF
jgi:hypothetical protein